ncbi:T9SS type A sorting domain-containing protein [Psychroserpens sp. SPM9]|uniref:T9SS type A sorting domain-containing protein n=1 Tax=Psychroserpens sp. SPM9 TaxID=2975598 RepID=UPI0021A42164|nr:T9SS type A sorting domain-containing protein [Psychroserpens sp. SPM9]MDG5491879.1 T9SS type A sorting domain-containing protein [Psychroserpens sp. SPM9]
MKKTLLSLLCLIFFSNSLLAQPFAAVQNIDPSTGNEPYEFASGDLDGDGDIDLVMATYDYNGGTPATDYIKWYKNDGSGNFTIEATVSSTVQWVDGLTVADVDGLFGMDIIVTSSNEGLTYYPSNAAGGFDPAVTIDATIVGPGEVVAGDINLDGNTDIATISFNDSKTVWYSGDGAGNFTAQPDIENGTGNGTLYVDLADFDGDTDLDAVVTYYNTQSIEIYYNQYIESGSTAVSWIKDVVTVDSGNSYLFDVGFADVNNDGTMDVISVDNVSGVVEWFNKVKNGTSTANTISTSSIISRPAVTVVADINNDGYNDVILTDGGTTDDAIIFFQGANNANPSATPTLIANNNYQMYDFTVDDYDADGDKDIASIGNSVDTVFWYENELITLSVSEFNAENLIIHPNPATDQLTFSGNFNEAIDISVYDALGHVVLSHKITSGERLDVSQLSDGVYIIKDDNSDMTKKFIKQ